MEENNQYNQPPAIPLAWYVVYTKPRWEKKVALLLSKKGIQNYCPLNKVIRQWSDRKKVVEEPLFSGYVFLKTTDADKWRIKEIDGILNYVHWLGKPAIVPEHEIETIKRFLNEHQTVHVSNTQFKTNDRVKIVSGAFIDRQAKVIAQKGKNVILEIPSLQLVLTAQVPISNLELIA
jgi:transcription antitermination factor NusG